MIAGSKAIKDKGDNDKNDCACRQVQAPKDCAVYSRAVRFRHKAMLRAVIIVGDAAMRAP